jgi:uncharacterized protein
MLLDFTVENFRSIKGAETLSAIAQKKRSGGTGGRVKSDDEIAPPFHIEGWDIDVLPVLAIFGANASGKSNILKALDFLLMFMELGNFRNSNIHIEFNEFSPFKLDKMSFVGASCFELRTVFSGTIYTYTLKLDYIHIFSERLEYTLASTKRPRLLFERNWNQELQIFEWKNGSDFVGSHIQLEKNLNLREPFISLLSRLDILVIQPLIVWLRMHSYMDYFEHEKILTDAFTKILYDEPQRLKQVESLLCKFDTGLSGVEIIKDKAGDNLKLFAVHDSEFGELIWEFEDESTGTQRLFTLLSRINSALPTNNTLIIDELGSNIHPNITREIVRLFQNPKTNPKRSQLIFTSHDNTLQRNNLLRRDQIWFTKKRSDQSTELYSLSDFKVRNDLAVDKAYLDGRFGAVPFISDDEELISSMDEDNG